MEFRRVGEPQTGHACADVLGGVCKVAGYANACGGHEAGCKEGKEFVVAVRGFDEYLGLAVAIDSRLDGFKAGGEFVGIDGWIAVEGEVLSVEAGGHECEDDAAGAYEGQDFDALTVSHGSDDAAGVSNAGYAGFAHEANVPAFGYGVEVVGYIGYGGVFVEFEEDGFVDNSVIAHAFEVAPGGAGVFNDEGAASVEHLAVVGWKRGVGRAVAYGNGEQYEFCSH